jgi:hypothetical protein
MDTQIIVDYLEKNKEWIFSGIGVTIIFGGIAAAIPAVIFLRKWIQNRKMLITVFQEGTSLYLHNGCKRPIDVHFVSFTLKDISCPKDLTRPPAPTPYSKPERPIDSGQNTKIMADVGKVFGKTIAEYMSDDKEAFRLQYPDWAFHVMLGLDIAVDFSVLGNPHVKRTIIERILSGYEQQGFVVRKNPYGKDSTMPTIVRLKEKLCQFLEHAGHPIEWLSHGRRMRLAQAKLTADCILKALHYKVISEEEAEARMNGIGSSLDADARNSLEQYLTERMTIAISRK